MIGEKLNVGLNANENGEDILDEINLLLSHPEKSFEVNMKRKIYGVIMAGGVGSRFWPRSREKSPKQLLKIVEGETMIQSTVSRIESLIPPEQIFVVTNKLQKNGVVKQLPNIPQENIIVEPLGRNTAPCIGLAALFAKRIDPTGVMVVLPADHIIHNVKEFHHVLKNGIEVAANSSALITIGISPTRPETGYGYIQFDDENSSANPFIKKNAFRVKTFAEKPTIEIANEFLRSGDFCGIAECLFGESIQS